MTVYTTSIQLPRCPFGGRRPDGKGLPSLGKTLPPTYDMKATIVYLAKPKAGMKRQGIVSISHSVGGLGSEISGWMTIEDTKLKKGSVVELPDSTKVSTRQSGDFVRLILQ